MSGIASTSNSSNATPSQTQEDIDIDKILNAEASLLNREEEVNTYTSVFYVRN